MSNSVPKALPKRYSELRLPDLLKENLSGFPSRNAQTVNKTLALISGIFAKAERDGFFDSFPGWLNPFHVGFEIAQTEKDPYQPFSHEELRRFFGSLIFTQNVRPQGGRGEAAFWFPLIALYTGARRTEIAQLKILDVRQTNEGIWFFDFSDRGEDQSLKNLSSARSVPIHSELLKIGFAEFLSARAGALSGEAPLWSGFEPPISSKTKAWTKWFSRYLSAHVVDHPAKTFHSFRHTFKRACREAGITEEIHHALTGHSGGGVGRTYGRERREDGSLDRGISLRRLQCEINKIAFPEVSLPSWRAS